MGEHVSATRFMRRVNERRVKSDVQNQLSGSIPVADYLLVFGQKIVVPGRSSFAERRCVTSNAHLLG
jgi:hypothetical protein